MRKINRQNSKENHSHIPFRLNFLFFIVFLLFVSLILRLAYLQIIKGEEYKAEVERTESTIVRGNVPRGEMYDAKLRPLVANEAKSTIMYTRGSNTKAENMAKVAKDLSQLIEIDHQSPFKSKKSDLSIRDLKDYFYATNVDEMKKRSKDYADENNLNINNMKYSDTIKLIDEAEVMDYSDEELKAAAIYTQMNSAYALSTVNIKNEGVSEKEIAAISEYSDSLPGITTGTDWNRIYPQGNTLRSILGSVSTEKQGIPEAKEKEYLAKGYSRNDRVGRSLIEYEYESLLRGSKSISKTETDNVGDILSKSELYPGAKGNNLILTIDMDFQNRVDKIVTDVLSKRRGLNEGVYAVAINPKNGKILAMSGKKLVDNEIRDDSLGTISKSYGMGSSVKAATVLTGYMDGVISLDNNVMVDERLEITDSPSISSVFNRYGKQAINDITAIQKSSNVYMAKIAMRMGGYWNYQQNQTLPIDGQATADKMRSYYQQFGLGASTGIDLPNEETGQVSAVSFPGETLYYSFGQFDTYTPMQLAQYISTVANGGIRYAPRLVSEVRETNPNNGEVGALAYEIEAKIMNTIDLPEKEFNRVQKGLYQVLNGNYGFAPGIFAGTPYKAAGKTGTAQAWYYGDNKDRRGESVTNITFAGYAPYDDPEIAVAVVIPYLPNGRTGTDHVGMTREIMDAYFEVGKYKDVKATEIEEE